MVHKKKYYKPSFFILLVILILTVLATGCVSQKKYDQALHKIARLSVDSTFQEYQITDVIYRKDNAINDKQDQVDAEREKLIAVSRLVNQQRSELRITKELLEETSNSDWIAEETNENLVIRLKDELLFETGSKELSPKGKSTIKDIAASIKKIDTPIDIWVIGHTDNQSYDSEKKDNWDLSTERALVVTRGLIDNNVNPSKITAAAKSKYEPNVSNASNLGQLLNRRTEIVLVPKTSAYQSLVDLINKKS